MSNWDEFVGSGATQLPSLGWEGDNAGTATSYGNSHEPDGDEGGSIFSLGRVQFALSSPLLSLSCCSNILLLTLKGTTPSPQIVRIDLDTPTEVETIDVPLVTPTQTHRTHVDPTGKHVVFSTATGENWYLFVGPLPSSHVGARKPKPLPRLKGAVIESVSWSSVPSSSLYSTSALLLGTSTGQILETTLLDSSITDHSAFSLPGRSGVERYVKNLYTLPERAGITGLRGEIWGSGASRRAVVVVATKTRIYQFVGGMPGSAGARRNEDDCVFEGLFGAYQGSEAAQPKSLELPGEPTNSELHFFAPLKIDQKGVAVATALPKSVAWLTGPGIYHGPLLFPSPPTPLPPGESLISTASLLPYPSEPTAATSYGSSQAGPGAVSDDEGKTEMPLSMVLTEWHFVLLYENCVRVVGLMSGRVVWEEELILPDGSKPVRLVADPLRRTYWLFTASAIYELVIKDEDRDVWKVYLGKSDWDRARRFAKTPKQRDMVLGAEADHYFTSGKFIQAAQCYAQSTRSFEEVALAFVDRNERDALRYYLGAKLERLGRGDLTQRMMVATWLVEIFLSKINQLEDMAAAERAKDDVENFNVEQVMLEDDMRQFLVTYKDNLDEKTVFDLLSSHGRDDMTLFYADLVGDHERIVTHWILEEEWKKALAALGKQDHLDLYYRFAPVLFRHSAKEAVESFMRQPNLDVRRLIPALVVPRRAGAEKQSSSPEHVIRYLQWAISDLQNTDPSVHNTLLTLLATDTTSPEGQLLHFLSASPDNPLTSQPYYSLDYALRLCRTHKRVQSCVMIYSKMGLYEASVDLALESDDLELAKINADKPEEDELLRKKLWLKIAKHVVGKKNDIKTAMRFLESTDLLKIEDILPFFPDFVVIDDFKDEICTALEGYSAHIERLKEDMDEATRSAEAIKSDIDDLRDRFVVVDASEKCGSCGQQLLTRQFYVFPCQHAFHADCLINEVTKHLSPTALRRMLDLQSQLAPSAPPKTRRQLEDSHNAGRKLAAASVQGLDQLRKLVLPDALLSIVGGAIPGGGTGGKKRDAMGTSAKKEAGEKQGLRNKLDELLASSCVLCEGGIASVDRPFVDEGEEM